ncbi:MAG TPA: hypothetical protein VEU96_30270 [Bryobacteraceae bacterium]|nr:hypothetical protein [Bryobacteraceae bacterium]
MKIRAQLSRVLAITCFVLPCAAQTGTVTFYSYALTPKQQAKAAVVPVGTASFTGWLYDGNKKMAHASRGRFMTFQLAAGGHDFVTSHKSNRPGKNSLHLDIESGGHYCVRLSARYVSPTPGLLIAFVESKIDQISCQQAVQEAGDYKRIDLKRVEPAVQAELDTSSTFPREN